MFFQNGRIRVEQGEAGDASITGAEHSPDIASPSVHSITDPSFGRSVVQSLRKHSYALVEITSAEWEKIARILDDGYPKAFVRVLGGRKAATIPVSNHLTSVLSKLADAVTEAVFVDLCGEPPQKIRRDLAPCFSATSSSSLLSVFQCPAAEEFVNTAEHFDRGLLTLSISDQNDGLQVLDHATQQWRNVEVQGCVVVMAGVLLSFAAPGVLVEPCRHRVVSLPVQRTSLTYKVRPSRDWRLEFPPLSRQYIPDAWAAAGAQREDRHEEGGKEKAEDLLMPTAGELMDCMGESVNEEELESVNAEERDDDAPADASSLHPTSEPAATAFGEGECRTDSDAVMPRAWQPRALSIAYGSTRFAVTAAQDVTVEELASVFQHALAQQQRADAGAPARRRRAANRRVIFWSKQQPPAPDEEGGRKGAVEKVVVSGARLEQEGWDMVRRRWPQWSSGEARWRRRWEEERGEEGARVPGEVTVGELVSHDGHIAMTWEQGSRPIVFD